jgi:O-antigen biosynthesis protein
MAPSPTVSVVVCAHSIQRVDMLEAALGSIARQSTAALETIVVIDHNPELQSRIANSVAATRVLANRRAQGLSGARNTGVDEARGEIVAFIDDDAVAAPDWIERLMAHYADPFVMGVGGRVVPMWPTERPRWLPEEFDWTIGCSYRGLPTSAAAVRNLIGCNMSFRRAVFQCAGLFSEGLGRDGDNAAGCEETELCIRARRMFPNAKIVYAPAAVVSHNIAANRLSWAYFRARCIAEGISKARVVATAGKQGLSSEAAHVRRVLPAGVIRGLADAVFRLDASGLQRAGAIVAGLGYVASSYLRARWSKPRQLSSQPEAFLPIRILDVDRSKPLDAIGGTTETEERYGGALCLVRESGRPIGVVEVPLYGSDMAAARLKPILESVPRPAAVARPLFHGREAPFARVVVATRDRAQSLALTLDTLLAQDYRRYEIVVVDNAPSTAETAELVAGRYRDSGRVRYLREDRPGLGHAHNCGVADADAEIVAFTDDDVIADPHWLGALVTNFADDAVGGVSGLILPAELDTRAQYWTERHGGFGKGFERRIFDLGAHRPKGALFPFAAGSLGSGANMAFRTRVLRAVGGFDGALGAGTIARGGDDLAAFVSVVRAGHQLVYEPEAIVWHKHRRSEAGMHSQAYGYGVGLGAYLTKFALEDPAVLFHYLGALPAAAAHLLNPASGKNARLPDDYPARWKWRERLGILAGGPAYLRSRAAFRTPLKTAATATVERWPSNSEPVGK